MPNPSKLRDCTEIVVPCASVERLEDDLEREFAVTVFDGGAECRIIGSPVEIQAASEFLVRRGVNHP